MLTMSPLPRPHKRVLNGILEVFQGDTCLQMGTHDVTHLRGDKSVGILKGWKEACAPGLGSDNPWLSLLWEGEEWSLKRTENSASWNYVIMPVMQGQIDTVEDDFWTEHRELFTTQFPTYYRTGCGFCQSPEPVEV